MIKKFLKKNWLILLILFLASFLRLYKIADYAEFLGDQGRDLIIVRDFLKNGNLFFIGPQTSVGNMYLGPFYYYLIAPALLLANFHPLGPAVFIALISVLTVYLIYYVGKKWFNPTAGYIAAFLYALSPVAIKFGTFSWNPNIMPLFSLLFIYFVVEKKYPLAALSFAMCFNSHYLALILLPIAGIIWLKNYSPKLIKPTLIAVFIFLLSLTPQILFDIKHKGQNISALKTFFTERETTVNLKAYKSIPIIPKLFNQINTSLLATHQSSFGLYISIILFIGLTILLFKDKRKNKYFIYCLVWYLLALVGLGLYKQHIYDHYFGFVFPVVFLLTGYLLSRISLWITLPALFVFSYLSISNLQFNHPGGRQIAHAQNIATAIDEHLLPSDGNYNLTMLASYNDFKAYAPRYFLKNQTNLLNTDLYSESNTLFVIVDDPQKWPKFSETDIWEINAFGNSNLIDEFTSSDGIKILKLQKIK